MRSIRATRTTSGTDSRLVRLRPALVGVATLLVVVLAAAVAAGCGGGSSDDQSGSGTTTQPSLEGTSWELPGWSISSQDPADFTITAAFKDGRIGGTSAVNQYGGPFTAGDDGSFSVGDLVSTMMAGPEPDMRAEQNYLKLLAEAKKYAVDGKTLTLSDANGNQSLIYTAATLASPGE
jgi:heat shock protein HslJ